MKRVAIVDEQDTIIRWTTREKLNPSDRHRISAVWVRSTSGKILLAQRSLQKRSHPGKWAIAVAGTVEDNETYETNAAKEIIEEIGVTGATLTKGPLLVYDGDNPRNCQVFITTIAEDTSLTLEPTEVEQTRWFTLAELREFFAAHPEQFTSTAALWLLPMIDYEANQ